MKEILNLIRFMTSSNLRKSINEPGKTLKPEEVKMGLSVSKLVLQPTLNCAVTPWFRTMLNQMDNLDKSQGKPLTNEMAETKAERCVMDFIDSLLDKYSPTGKDQKYVGDDDVSPSYYDVDNHRNNRSLRQLPKLVDQTMIVQKKYSAFTKPCKDIGIVDKLKYDKRFAEAVSFVLELMPYFTSSDQIVEVNSYFASKHTNVGAPYFKNDKTLVDSKDPESRTYADVTLEDAKKVTGVKDLYKIQSLYNRFKNLSGRQVLATSRIANMYFNQILRPANDVYRERCTFMWTYNNIEKIKEVMIKNKSLCPDGYTMNNRDYSSYDSTISPDEKLLGFAMIAERCRDFRGKKLVTEAAGYYTSSMLALNGHTNRLEKVFARMYSGELFTNFVENIINAVESVYCHMLLDPNFIKMCRSIIDQGGAPILIMGDDNSIMELKTMDDEKYSALLKQHFGKILYPLANDKAKGEKGYFVLQYRLFKNGNAYAFATPYPRIIQSMAIRARPVGLGYYGWCMFAFQQFERLREVPDIQREVIRFWAKWDSDKFGTNGTALAFRSGLKKEDQEALKAGKSSSSERLYDGDPQRVDNYTLDEGVIDWSSDYVVRMFRMIKAALSSGGDKK